MSSPATSSGVAVIAMAAASVAALGAAVYLVYTQRDTLIGYRSYRRFERKYADQLRASRLRSSEQQLQQQKQQQPWAATDEGSAEEAVEVSTSARVKVIYGSDAGNAEAFARGLVMTLRDRGASAALIDPSRWSYLDRYTRHTPRQSPLFHFLEAPPDATRTGVTPAGAAPRQPREVLIFVVSTAGEGEPPANFLTLFQEMRAAAAVAGTSAPSHTRAVPPPSSNGPSPSAECAAGPFDGVAYAVFALGDSSYKYYCRCGMSVATMLRAGGATELRPTGFGDARGGAAGQEHSFDQWQDALLLALTEKAGVVLGEGSLDPPMPQTRLEVFPITSLTTGEAVDPCPFPAPPPLFGPALHCPALLRLMRCERLTAVREDDGSAILRLSFDIAGANVVYQAGDHLGIYPANPDTAVARCAALLGLTPEALAAAVELREDRTRTASHNTLPARVPLRTALTHYVDLCGRPKKSALRVLATYCADESQKRAFLAEVEGQWRCAPPAGDPSQPSGNGGVGSHDATGSDRSEPPPRTVLDYMTRYDSCCGRIPVGHFMEVMPRIQPRYYSIGTDRASHPEEIHIYIRALKDGLASTYLTARVPCTPRAADPAEAGVAGAPHRGSSWRDPSLVFAYVRPSTFHLPASLSPSAPVLMIGPGTGAAAMAGLLYRREALMRREPTQTWGECVLFFGARHAATEFFIRDEVTRWCMSPTEMAAFDEANPRAPVGAAYQRARDKRPLASRVVTELACAFSRDQSDRMHVTHLIAARADAIYDMITNNKDSVIFLSGDATFMAKDVDRALVEVIQSKGKKGRLSALGVLQSMEREHRYLKDVY